MSGRARRDAVRRALDRLRAARELELDALLVESLVDLRYLTGFSGSNGARADPWRGAAARLGAHRFLTDFRYETQSAAAGAGDLFEREIVAGDLLEAAAAGWSGAAGRLGFDESAITVTGTPPAAGAAARRLGARRLRRARGASCAQSRTRGRSPASAPPANWPTRR